MLDVPGATLHYKVQGEGPLLLVLQAGDADADTTDAIAGRLADTWRVVSYDRRGLARSPLDDPAQAPDIATHSDGACRLLAHLTDEPALVFGVSIGALDVAVAELPGGHSGFVLRPAAFAARLREVLA